jgi:tetratricopeptide (TPR) repeat protein
MMSLPFPTTSVATIKVKVRLGLAVLWALILLFSNAASAQCGGSGPRPDWIDSPETVTADYFFAAGVSANPRAALAERIATAKQNALRSLSEVIEVSVKNSLVLEQSSRKSWGFELTDSNLSAITQTSSNASLRNVEIIETWEDPKSCDLWLRARVAQSDVEKGKREGMSKLLFASLKANLELAQNENEALAKRLSAVDASRDMLPRIAFEAIAEANSAEFYNQLLSKLGLELRQALDKVKQARADWDAANLLVSEASAQPNESEKSKRLAKAATFYKSLLARYGSGLPDVFASGDVLFKLGEVEELRGSSCGAKSYYQQAQDSKQLNDRREIARKKAETLGCSAQDMEKTLWRQYFEGRPITLICYFKAGAQAGAWHKACDGLNSAIRPLGAEVTLRTKSLSDKQLLAFTQGALASGTIESQQGLVLAVVASGKMVKRAGEYQFDGEMASILLDEGELVFSDRFKGITGWNPISAEMVMDVLGINVIKRWQGKFSKFLHHELN